MSSELYNKVKGQILVSIDGMLIGCSPDDNLEGMNDVLAVSSIQRSMLGISKID
jgi:hypothetical protein